MVPVMPSPSSSAPRILSAVSLQDRTTFAVAARARWFVDIESEAQLRALHADPLFVQQPRLVLGGGSNILFTRDFDGLVIHNAIRGIAIVRQDDDHVWVRAGAGEVWHDLVLWSVERGLGGLENLALIPGLVGAAPMQNIGAYGVEMESSCEAVEAFDVESAATTTFTHRDCEFGYRDSVFKHRARDRFIVTAVTFRLHKQPRLVTSYGDVRATLDAMGVHEPTVRTLCEAIVRIRSAKLPDPRRLGNAGSFFKNPVLPADQAAALRAAHPGMPHYPQADGRTKVPAAWLIEQCGWKGRTIGRAGVHDRQALVLVNRGGASGAEILALAHAIQASVHDRYGIELQPEVNVL